MLQVPSPCPSFTVCLVVVLLTAPRCSFLISFSSLDRLACLVPFTRRRTGSLAGVLDGNDSVQLPADVIQPLQKQQLKMGQILGVHFTYALEKSIL